MVYWAKFRHHALLLQLPCLLLLTLAFSSASHAQFMYPAPEKAREFGSNGTNPYEKRRQKGAAPAVGRPLPALPLVEAPLSKSVRLPMKAERPPLPLLQDDVPDTAALPTSRGPRVLAMPPSALRSRPGFEAPSSPFSVQRQPLPETADFPSPSGAIPTLSEEGVKAAFESLPAETPPAQPEVAAPPAPPAVTEPFPLAAKSTESPAPLAPASLTESAPASVSELPVAAAAEGKSDAQFFTPDSSAPTVGDAAGLTAPAEQLSEETKRILDALPRDALPRPISNDAPDVKGDFAIKRANDSEAFSKSDRVDEVLEGEKKSEAAMMDVRLRPQSIDITYELERAYNALVSGDTDTAIYIYEQVLSIDPQEKTALFGLATTYHRIGMLDQARPVYGKLLAIDPYNVEALNNFFALVGDEAPQAAIEQLKLLAMDNPDFSPIQAQIALLYQKIGNLPLAIEYMAKAAISSPENLAYKYNLAVLYDTNNQAEEAIRIYRYLLKLYEEGQDLPASPSSIQQRLTFLASN
jgi:tetratricopeptide (TPR) repeat protein